MALIHQFSSVKVFYSGLIYVYGLGLTLLITVLCTVFQLPHVLPLHQLPTVTVPNLF